MTDLIERLRRLPCYRPDVEEAMLEAATLLERQSALLEDAKIALSRLLAYAEECQSQFNPEWDGQCFDDSDFGIASSALKALESTDE